jgi:hypothetical protein
VFAYYRHIEGASRVPNFCHYGDELPGLDLVHGFSSAWIVGDFLRQFLLFYPAAKTDEGG